MSTMTKNEARQRRKIRIRKKISGTADRPRLVVFRSNLHMYAQVVDDVTGSTLAAASTPTPFPPGGKIGRHLWGGGAKSSAATRPAPKP